MKKKINSGLKKVLIIYGTTLFVLITTCFIIFIVYSQKIKKTAQDSLIAAEKMTELVPNNYIFEETSSELSQTIEEAMEEATMEIAKIENEEENIVIEELESEKIEDNTLNVDNIEEEFIEEPVKELAFIFPVEGEIIKPYSVENLVFSETLQEWTVHKGIDIKAARTTVVKASEAGTVSAIKNDPRYGLTVIIEHRDGYKTVYSNLLTAEFVTEGEEVQIGQTIGTVGNSAAFEIADEPHLHFEILKDEENIDPMLTNLGNL